VADVDMPESEAAVKVVGESQIPKMEGQIRRVWLEPNNPQAYPPAVQAILSADLIIIGPGSLYTSLVPNLLVPDLAEALKVCRALKMYVANIATQPGETRGYTCGDHVRTLEQHLGQRLFDLVVYNKRYQGVLPGNIEWVKAEANLEQEYSAYAADLIDIENPWRHDSQKLAKVIIDLFNERTGPLSGKDEEPA
jgi:uncharacterized cofD-like protein